MSATKRWTLIIGGLLLANLFAVMVLTFFSHGDIDRRVVPGYQVSSPR